MKREPRTYSALITGAKLLIAITLTHLLIDLMHHLSAGGPFLPVVKSALFETLMLGIASALSVYFFVFRPLESAREQRRAAEFLQAEHDRLQQYLDVAKTLFVVIGRDEKIVLINKTGYDILGFDKTELTGKNWFDTVIPERFRESVRTGFHQLMAGDLDRLEFFENPVVTKNGEERLIAWHNTLLKDAHGTIISSLSSGEDITESRQAADALRAAVKRAEEEKAKSEAIIEAIGDGVTIQDTDFKILYQNEIQKNLLGDHLGEYCYSAYENKDSVCDGCAVALSFHDGNIHTVERSVVTDRGLLYVEITASAVRDSTGNIIAGIEIVRDITKRKQAAAALKKREAQLAESQRMAHIGSWERDLVTGRSEWSDETFRIFGYDPQTTTPGYQAILDRLHPSDRDGFVKLAPETLPEGQPYALDYRIIRPDGTEAVVHALGEVIRDASGKPVFVKGTAQDITERTMLEEQLRQAQKMEAVGQLAGGVAHDFNNILTAVLGDAFILEAKLDANSPFRRYVDDIRSSAERAAALTQSLLAYSRKQILNPRPIDLNAEIRKLHNLTARLINESIEYTTTLSGPDLTVILDSGLFEQVMLNLITNAVDAMPLGGSLSIATQRALIDYDYIASHGFGRPGVYALTSVSDSGTGMDDKTREKIFEPFFTTKEVGKGTGLGLAIVYGIVKQHNGFIICESEPGKGTTFHIYLPLGDSPVDERQKVSPDPASE